MALSSDQPLKSESTNPCCDQWKKRISKLQESRNALRQAVKLLENKINEIQAQNLNLKKIYEEERLRAKLESEEKLKEYNARVSLENEVCGLKSEITIIQQKRDDDSRDGNESIEGFQACIADKEKEISILKEHLEAEKRKADIERKSAEKERKKASEARKLLEAEKNKNVEKGAQIARIEAEKTEEYRTQLGRLEKEVNEAKTKLASEMSKFKEANKRFEAEKQKMLAEKRNAELGMKKANERLEVEKQKATQEKRRADAEVVKAEAQKALTEDNLKKFMEEKRRADQMSRKLEEDKQTIEGLKQKITELSSMRGPIEIAGASTDIGLKAESTKMKLLKSELKLEKLRAKNARQKCKLEASHHSILRHELGRLKIDFIQLLHRFDMLDASFSPVAGSMQDQTKNANVMRQVCNSDLSQMHSQFENELLKPCCTMMDGCDPLRKNMQHILALSGGNYSESITCIDSKLEPLVRESKRTKLQSSALNSGSESFSGGQLMGSQETTAFPATASAKLDKEIFNARQGICSPSDRSVAEHHMKRKSMHDIANLSSENLPDLHGSLDERGDKCLEGGREMLHNLKILQEKNDRGHKKRKKSHMEKVDMVPQINQDEKKGREESKAKAYEDANVCRHTSCPAPNNLETTQACGDRICDADFDSMICFDKVDGNYMKLLELEDAAVEECYRRAMDYPLSPSLPEFEFHETFDVDNLKNPFLEEALREDMLSPRTNLFPSPSFDVINVEINSNGQNFDVSGVSSNSKNKPTPATVTEVVKLSHMHTTENSGAAYLAEGASGPLHNQFPKLCVVFSNIDDSSAVTRIVFATKACIARCNLATQTGWEVSSILTALRKEEKLSQKEKASVLLTLMLFNFMAATMTFGKLCDGNLFHCLNSYAEHIRTVMSDAEARILFLENYSLQELLGLIEDFLIQGKVIVNNTVAAEKLSDCDLRTNDVLDCANNFSSDVASSEQLVAGSIILASICAATNHVGFIRGASYDILRLCKWDSLMVLTILHIFSYLGGEFFFVLDNFRLLMTVLKSLVMFLEGENLSVATASCPPSIDLLHTEFCMNVKCPFLEGAESIDIVACLLLEEIKSCCLQGIERVDLSDSRSISDNYNAGQWSNPEAVQCAINKNCDVPCCLEKCTISSKQPCVLNNVTFCHLSDVLSLVELVANKMSWHWTDIKLVPQLLNILDSCAEENFVIAIIIILGQLGRIGVVAGGYGDRGVEKLRCNLITYLCNTSSMKHFSLQIATASALFGLLPLDLETLFHTNSISLPAYSKKSASDDVENLRKWFSGLGKDQQKLLSDILSSTDVYNK